MNAPERLPLPDIQASMDTRRLAIQQVGVRGMRVPVQIRSVDGSSTATVASVEMTVGLPAEQKGTHMSRFIEILERDGRDISTAGFAALFDRMLERLEADTGMAQMRFPFFRTKKAPVSGVESLMDYDVTIRRERKRAGGTTDYWLTVLVPVTSLCPCSRDISAYGAHNQRSHVTIAVQILEPVAIAELIGIAERAASCELYGLLKRPDEKYVTERAYDNPKFVEDLVRDVAMALKAEARIGAFRVESENFESIHNHSAYALIEHDPRA